MTLRLARAAAALAAVLALGGCVSLLPKSKPVQLYRFTYPATTMPPPASGQPQRIGLSLSHIDMERAAAGDRILTVTGSQAAFVEGARWLSPASVLFESEVKDAFEARSARVRLLDRAEFAAAAGILRLDVPDFETRYAASGQAPTVRVTVRATLTSRASVEIGSQDFTAEVPAADNRMGAIVAAYDQAVARAAADLIAWTDTQSDRVAASVPPGLEPRRLSR